MGAFSNNGRRPNDDQLPTHYCLNCTGVLLPERDVCDECDAPRPDEGWASIQDGFDPWLGRILDGRYLVNRRVGQGAAGSVYRVSSLAIRREFAVKIINYRRTIDGVDPEQVRARLSREIDALSRLRNPHVVPFYEVIELYDDFVGIVMDYVTGRTLESLISSEGGMPSKRAIHLLRQLANGLHEAHEAGMIHRDLKPENLMVERMPAGDDFVHILDFGIVRMEDGVSMTQGFLGTPLYASPEQAMAGEVDRRSDIYSLGAIFFFMLTGRPPFQSENVYEVLRSHVRSPIPSLSEVCPDRTFPSSVEELLREMLAKSPENRPNDLSEVIRRADVLLKSKEITTERNAALESVEIDPIRDEDSASVKQTANRESGLDTDNYDRTSFKKDQRESSDSFLVSTDRDKTGPKAAIFRKNPTRGTVRTMLEESRRSVEEVDVDRVLKSDTAAYPLGIQLGHDPQMGAASHDRLVVSDSAGDFSLVSEGEAKTIATGQRRVNCLAVSAANTLAGYQDGVVSRISDDGALERLFQDVRRAPINAVATAINDSLHLAGSESGRVYMASRPRKEPEAWTRIQDGPPVAALAVSVRGDCFAVARKHREIEIFNIGNPRAPFSRLSVAQLPKTMAFSPDGHLLAILLADNTVHLYMALTGQRIMSIRDEKRDLVTVGFNQDTELIGYFFDGRAIFGLDLQHELEKVQA